MQSKIQNLKSKIGALLLSAFCLLPSAFAQTPITAPWIQTPDLQITTAALTPVTQATAQMFSGGGTTAWYYWIVARYALGNAAPAGPFVGYGPTSLSGSNYMIVSWNLQAGATGYDVLRTPTATLTGSGNYAIATNISGPAVNDTGASPSSYTVNTYTGGTAMEMTSQGIRINGSYGVNGQCPGSTGGMGMVWTTCAGSPGTNIFSSFQFSTNTPVTTANNYFQLLNGAGINETYTGAGSSGNPYIATLSLAPPTTSTPGGVLAVTCAAGQFINGIPTSGQPPCGTPGNVSTSGSPATSQIPVFTGPASITGYSGLTSDTNGNVTGNSFTGSIMDKGGQIYNVRGYGAVGNGVADDTAAYNATQAAAYSTGGIVYFPQGTYNLKNPNPLNTAGVANKVSLRCAGARSTTINFTGASGILLSENSIFAPFFGGVVEGCNFALGSVSSGNAALTVQDSAGWTIRDNSFSGASGQIGVELKNVTQWCERNHILFNQFFGLSPSIEFSQNASEANVSFGYNYIVGDQMQIPANGYGFLGEGNNNPNIAYMYHGFLDFTANGTTGAIYVQVQDKFQIQNEVVHIVGENGAAAVCAANSSFMGGGITGFIDVSNAPESCTSNPTSIALGLQLVAGGTATAANPSGALDWQAGKGTPSGGCNNGDLYSNAAGASGTTLYACVAGAWVDVK